MTQNDMFIMKDLNKEKYKDLHYVWSSSKIGFFHFLFVLLFFNLMILALSALARLSITMFDKADPNRVDLSWLKLDDFWAKIAVEQFSIVKIMIILLIAYMFYIWFRYANRNFQKFDQGWERFIFISFAIFVFLIHVLIMAFIPNFFNMKMPVTIFITVMYIIFVYFSIYKAINSFKEADQSNVIIKINKLTKKIAFILLLIYPIYIIIKNQYNYRDSTGYFWLLVILLVFLHFIISPNMLGWQLKQVIFRNYFVKYSEEFRDKFQMTKEEWYGTKSK